MRKQDAEKWVNHGIIGIRKEVQIKNKVNNISKLPIADRIKKEKAREKRFTEERKLAEKSKKSLIPCK